MFDLFNMDTNYTDYLGHAAYALIFFSFLVSKMLWLRSIAISASILSIAYNYTIAQTPLWIPIQWNVLFITVNLYHITVILLSKRDIKLESEEEIIYQKVFSHISRSDFKKLVNLGFKRTWQAKEKTIIKGTDVDSLFLIIEGEVTVLSNGNRVARLGTCNFIGEMSFLTGAKAKADIVCNQKTKIYYWDKESLNEFLFKNIHVYNGLNVAIANQLIARVITPQKSTIKVSLDQDKSAA